jgi:hypothetical protein
MRASGRFESEVRERLDSLRPDAHHGDTTRR